MQGNLSLSTMNCMYCFKLLPISISVPMRLHKMILLLSIYKTQNSDVANFNKLIHTGRYQGLQRNI